MAGYGEESIYNLIPPPARVFEKPPMYRSQHAGKIPPTASTFGHAQTSHPVSTNLAGDSSDKVVGPKACRTMGWAPGVLKPHPDEFMKRGAKTVAVKLLSEVRKEEPALLQPSALKPKLKPDVPKPKEMPIMNLVTSKNFIVANAVETILAAPKKVPQGTKDYLAKEDYGKVPRYLKQIKQDIEDEYDYIHQLQEQEEAARKSAVRQMSDEEKGDLINGLKAKWEQVNTDYQASTHLTKLDTIGKISRKETCEAQLSQIEKDIEKLNRKGILVDQTS